MLDGLGINGIKPIDDNPSRNPNGKNRKYGQKFSIEEVGDEIELDKKKKRPLRKGSGRKKQPPPSPNQNNGGIDIVI
ncbi:MAG: hypothetical protein KJ645_12995 [Planctomycetes bacterium]|nr:hypothetical protein [Planctomycetota bacterium]